MGRTEVEQQRRRARLLEAVKRAGGEAKLGALLGHSNGASVSKMLTGERPVSERTIDRLESRHGWGGWFTRDAVKEPAADAVLEDLASILMKVPDDRRAAIGSALNVLALAPDSARTMKSLRELLAP